LRLRTYHRFWIRATADVPCSGARLGLAHTRCGSLSRSARLIPSASRRDDAVGKFEPSNWCFPFTKARKVVLNMPVFQCRQNSLFNFVGMRGDVKSQNFALKKA